MDGQLRQQGLSPLPPGLSGAMQCASAALVFSSTGHHHLPVIDADQRLVGILTQTDLVRALDALR